jgi:hypothetical protein
MEETKQQLIDKGYLETMFGDYEPTDELTLDSIFSAEPKK